MYTEAVRSCWQKRSLVLTPGKLALIIAWVASVASIIFLIVADPFAKELDGTTFPLSNRAAFEDISAHDCNSLAEWVGGEAHPLGFSAIPWDTYSIETSLHQEREGVGENMWCDMRGALPEVFGQTPGSVEELRVAAAVWTPGDEDDDLPTLVLRLSRPTTNLHCVLRAGLDIPELVVREEIECENGNLNTLQTTSRKMPIIAVLDGVESRGR